MLKWIETTGKTEEAAVQAALEQLGLDRDSVSVEIVDRAKAGVFGIGSKPAKVRVSYEAPDEPAPAEEVPAPEVITPAPAEPEVPAEPEIEEVQPAPAEEPAPAPAAPAAKAVPAGNTVEDSIRAFLSGLLSHLGTQAEVCIEPKEDSIYLVTLEGQKLGALIGHRGETLDAIQQLTNYSINRGRAHRVRIHIDAENYRAKREDSLKRLANKVAAKVVKYRKNITLEPMNAYERHVIHETLQDVPDVITYSTGTEPNRRTVVAYSRGKHSY